MSTRSVKDAAFGVALTPNGVAAAGAGFPGGWYAEVELHGGANGAREALAAALADAARAAGSGGEPRIVVALLSPLAELRALTLPPLPEDDRNRFLARNASRYFVAARGAQVVGSASADGNGSVLAAAAAHQLVTAVHAAGVAAGCTVTDVVPAESAWAAAARALWPVFARGTSYVIVAHDDRADLLTLANGALAGVRRFRGAGDAAQLIGIISAGGSPASGRVAIVGVRDQAAGLAAALAQGGVRALVPDPSWRAVAERPEMLAARFATDARGIVFRSDESRDRDRGETRRATLWTLALAGAVLLVAAAVQYQGVKRELASVRAARAAIRPQVEATLVGRSSVDATYRQVAALAAAARGARRWSAILGALAVHLPDDASLTALRARGDSVFMDGVATRAAPVFDAIAGAPGVAGVRATAPVRRESIEGELPLEHFAIGAQLLKVKR